MLYIALFRASLLDAGHKVGGAGAGAFVRSAQRHAGTGVLRRCGCGEYAERKPLIWFWMMFDRSPVGLNHWLGFRMRAMLAKHVFKHIGQNVKIFHGVEISFGYNLTVEDNCTIHKYVLLDDRGEIIVHAGSSISDYANVYSHAHDLNDGMIVSNHKTELGPKARVTYHATVMSGVKVGEHGLVGAMGVASKDVEPYHIRGRNSGEDN